VGDHASHVHKRLKEKVQWLQDAGTDFRKTRLFYRGRHLFHEHTKKYGMAEALVGGVLIGGVVLTVAPLPRLPEAPPKSSKEAAVDAFKSKRAQLGQGQMMGYEDATPHPKLYGDRRIPVSANTMRGSNSSGAWSGSGRNGSSRRTVARRQKQEPCGDDFESDDDGASMSA